MSFESNFSSKTDNGIVNNSIPRDYNKNTNSSPNTNSSKDSVLPSLNLPKGGGAIKGIDEKLKVNSISGTAAFSIPIPFSKGRNGYTPSLGLSYNSGNGNSPFGLGWQVDIPSITRKTDNGLPQYRDEEESDTFILSGAEDLVPLMELQGGVLKNFVQHRTVNGVAYTLKRYRPRIEGLFARIEKWENDNTKEIYWRTISSDNSTSYYGLTNESRISDPEDSSKVFQWLLCHTNDDKGNIVLFSYKKEDFAGIPNKLNEANRINHCTQWYLKKILYCNKTPYYLGDAIPSESDFLFKIIFDYGEHDPSVNIPKDVDQEKTTWACRKDPFSLYRSGFEIRTYRRCSRVLIFHCFSTDELPVNTYLVKSLQLFYDDNLLLTGNNSYVNGFSFLTKARQNGHIWNDALEYYTTKYLPELELQYQQHTWNTTVQSITPDNLTGAPVGIDDKTYLWVDLFSEGIAGILTEQGNEWLYKSNLGNGSFTPALPLAPIPSYRGLNKTVFIEELEGNGVKYFVDMDSEQKGFFKLKENDEWHGFRLFDQQPSINLKDPNVRFIDLTGDNIPDILYTDEYLLRWYKGVGEKGFEVSEAVLKETDEEKGPAIIFADLNQSIFLADMSGDGLSDIVRIRNGEICYWPNKGYGHFGAKVNMDNAPLFDYPDSFNPAFLRLADIDGSGTTDVIYLGKNDFKVWMNLNGNEWSVEPQVISNFPLVNNLADIAVLDFLGTGTASIVYSSPIAKNPLQYIDLMGSKKPALLIGYKNNCGKEVTLEYKPSTFYYLDDKIAGIPWITKLPFPVHCISKVISKDKVRQTVFSNSYSYSHGYYDSLEKEFRGFARVEQNDTEEFDRFKLNDAKNVIEEDLYQPAVKTISWFHTGAYLQKEKLLHQCETEYYHNSLFTEYQMPEPQLPSSSLLPDEIHEALRACKGLQLRTEVYAMDGSPKQAYPYTASQFNCEIRLIQPKSENRYASFLVIPSESIAYSYERIPADPRIAQSFVLEADELGNITKSASVIYPRVLRPVNGNAVPDIVWNDQNKMHLIYAEAFFTNDILEDDTYRLRNSYESKSYELSGISQPPNFFFQKNDIGSDINNINSDPTKVILFETDFNGTLQKRLSRHQRRYFMKDDLTGPYGLGVLSSLGIAEKSYTLAFTKNLVTKYYGTKVTDVMLAYAKYVHSEGDEHWWAQPGDVLYPANAKNTFYIPIGTRDVFGNENYVEYDHYIFLVQKTTDAIGNFSTASNDYRTLSPVIITDANLNRVAVATDELGLVIKSAVMGKEGAGEGDTIADPTTRMEYDLLNWQNNQKPNYVHTFAREKHGAANPRWQESYAYSDAGGGIIMTKNQAHPGIAKKWNSVTHQVDDVNANPRWVGNGRTIINNKGNVVKKYEPYFSTTFEYESEDDLVETGVTPLFYYDPDGRNIRTEFPNGTYTKVAFDSWLFKCYDVNDTVKSSQWYADRGSPDPLGPEPADPETRAAWLASKCDNTPSVSHTDSFGRSFYKITDYGSGKTTSVYSETDLAGRYSKVFDQLGRNVAEGYTNMTGNPVYGKTAEKGDRWIFSDTMGRLVRMWDNNVREMYATFDQLNRPISSFIKEGAATTLLQHTVYGDLFSNADAISKNLKGCAYQIYDQIGAITINQIDFKGNPLDAQRKLTKEYKQAINWGMLDGLTNITAIQTAAEPLLESEIFTSSAELDALSRPVSVTLPDQSVFQPQYNEANFLESLKVQIRGAGAFTTFLDSQDYDAKGQRQFAKYGNGCITNYFYDSQTFRLVNLITKLNETDTDAQSIQDLKYNFDPVGNITQIRDNAQETNFFKNAVVYPENKYEYDAVYQLMNATGREHAGLGYSEQRNNVDFAFINKLPDENDANAVRNYIEHYEYDDSGNIKQLKHIATGANWTQRYQYEYEVDPGNKTNRLKATSLPGDASGVFSATYLYDIYGNMTSMPHLSDPNSMQWDFSDQLKEVNLGGGGTAYYVYGLGGSRMRKIIERQGGKKTERIYLGGVEIYRESQGNSAPNLERYTLLISDNTGRIAQVDTKTIDLNNSDTANGLNEDNIRYQFHNHLGSAVIETDDFGNIISYEEYHPYGTSSYRLSKPGNDISLKRYRFSGKEHDDETGFYYIGARYYSAWLARWTSSDPAGFVDGLNLFKYCSNNPVVFNDPNGTDGNRCMYVLAQGGLVGYDTIPGGCAQVKAEGHEPSEVIGYVHLPSHTPTTPSTSSTTSSSTPSSPPRRQTQRRPHPAPHVGAPPAAAAPTTPSPPPPPAAATQQSAAPSDNQTQSEAGGANVSPLPDSLTNAGPGLEQGIWERSPFDRGYTLEHLYSDRYLDAYNATRDNRANFDVETQTHVQQIKTNEGTNAQQLRSHASRATRDAGAAIADNPTGTMSGKSPQAVVITPTDAPSSAGAEIRAGYDNIRTPVPNSTPPEHVRGIPGTTGRVGRGLTYGGTALSGGFFIYDLYKGDYTMAGADAISTAGGAAEIYALSTAGATILGVGATSAGLVLGGVGMALASGIGAYRDFKAGNYGWGAVGVVGALAGVAVVAGVIFSAPALVVGGLIVGAAVGVLQLGRWISSWFD